MDSTAKSAQVLVRAIERDLKPRDIITRKSIANAIAVVMATGGSTNAVLHFLGIAKAAGVKWTIDDFERVASRTPVLCDLKPSGRYVAVDFHRAGGVRQLLKILLDHGRIDGSCITITGRTIAEEIADVPTEPPSDQDVIRSWSEPLYDRGHLSILKGNLSTEGCVAKTSGIKQPSFTGPARVFDSEQACLKAILARKIKVGDVIVIRYEGPKGGPGMPEMLSPTAALVGQGLLNSVALITDGRFSGESGAGSWGMSHQRHLPGAQSPWSKTAISLLSTRTRVSSRSMCQRKSSRRERRSGGHQSPATRTAFSRNMRAMSHQRA